MTHPPTAATAGQDSPSHVSPTVEDVAAASAWRESARRMRVTRDGFTGPAATTVVVVQVLNSLARAADDQARRLDPHANPDAAPATAGRDGDA